MMAFYKEKQQIYLEAYASGVSIGSNLLQMRNGMWFLRNEAPNNATISSLL